MLSVHAFPASRRANCSCARRENLTSACTLLATLAADHRANQLQSAQHGALPLLVALISSPPSSQPGTKERHA